MFNIIMAKIRLILKSPMILFIYGLFSKWYIMITLAAVVVVFWVLKGLVATGIIGKAEKILFESLSNSKSIAQHCTPKILDLNEFWSCLANPPKYEATKEEIELEKAATELLDPETYKEEKDPYSEEESKAENNNQPQQSSSRQVSH